MQHLSPKRAVKLAIDIYSVEDDYSADLFFKSNEEFYQKNKKGLAVTQQGKALSTMTGGRFFFQKESGFGICARGTGEYSNDLFIIFRGTASFSDFVTDIRGSVTSSAVGEKTHMGFSTAFNTLLPKLDHFLKSEQTSKRRISRVHCIGHSLGGAVANLAALYVADKKFCNDVVLYTFGCPRVGLKAFANRLTSALHTENIHRVYHNNDVVTMVGPYPFLHAPVYTPGIRLIWPGANLSGLAHSSLNYEKSIGNCSWEQLSYDTPELSATQIEMWLAAEGDGALWGMSWNVRSTQLQYYLNRAIKYVVDKISHIIPAPELGSGTLLDYFSYILCEGLTLISDVSIWVLRLMRRIAQVLGVPGAASLEVSSMTYNFIRYLFDELLRRIGIMVKEALKANQF